MSVEVDVPDVKVRDCSGEVGAMTLHLARLVGTIEQKFRDDRILRRTKSSVFLLAKKLTDFINESWIDIDAEKILYNRASMCFVERFIFLKTWDVSQTS